MKLSSLKNLFIGAFLMALVGSGRLLSAATVETQKMDYPPGSTAVITGSGWVPGEEVTLQVLLDDGSVPSGDDQAPWTVLADEQGRLQGYTTDASGTKVPLVNFNGEPYTTWHVCDCLGASLVLTAVGSSGDPESVAWKFTDGPSADPCTICLSTVTPPAKTAVVDGNISEWNTSTSGPDYWDAMYNAGNPDPTYSGYAKTANAFVRYECGPDNSRVTVHVLVLSSDQQNFPALVSATDAWAAIGGVNGKLYTGATGNDGTAPDFAWVGVGYDGDQNHALGYEASFTLPTANSPWSCFVIHVEAFNKIKGVGQTSGTSSFNGPGKCLSVVCPADPPPPGDCTDFSASANASPIPCHGGDSSVVVSATGGKLPYSGTGTFTEKAGSHTYTVTDANDCSFEAKVAIPEPDELNASSSATPISCHGGSSTVTVGATGGTGPYQGTGTYTVTAGTYTYTITDAHSCSAVTTVVIGEPDELKANSSATPIGCHGGDSTITVGATGGTEPYIGTGTYTVKAGSHTYTVTDGNGCTADTTVEIGEPDKLVASSSGTPIGCHGGDSTITVGATGGTEPYIGTGTYTVKAGSYTYTVTDAKGCTAETKVEVGEPDVLAATVADVQVCLGSAGTLTASASGGTLEYSYLWSNGAQTQSIQVTDAGTYTVTVTDAHGCSTTASGKLSYTTTYMTGKIFYDTNANGIDDDGQVVAGVKVTLSALGFTAVSIYTGADGTYLFTGLLPGIYTVTETLPSGYINTTPISVTVTLGCDPISGIVTGNECTSLPTNGYTLGFWSNSNGQAILKTNDTAWRTLLNGCNLRNANGSAFTVASGSFNTVYNNYHNWLLNATATNMAYMLSAQLAANVSDVAYKGLSGSTILVISPLLKTPSGVLVATTLVGTPGYTRNAVTGFGYITIANLQAAAKASLLANPNTTKAGAVRNYQECLKSVLDQSNNNGGGGYNIPLTVVSTTPCTVH